MKKAIVLAALTFASASAFASTARMNALGATATNVQAVTTADDVQEIFYNPAKVFNFGDVLTIETAGEGGFIRSHGDSKYGIYFNNKSATFAELIAKANAAPFSAGLLTEQNPFEVFYGTKGGDLAWALSFKYSQAEDKKNSLKANTMGLRAGVGTDAYEAYINLGLAGKSESAAVTAQNDLGLRIGGEYFLGDSTVYADIVNNSAKVTASSTDTKVTKMDIQVGYETKVKQEGAIFFYGAKLASKETKAGDNAKVTSTKLPVYAGIEGDVAAWLTLRGYMSQSVLLNSTKEIDSTGGTTSEGTGLTDTAANLGATLKLGKVSIDGLLGLANGATAGHLNSSDLMSQVALNYAF